jgi:hypothetical protein
MRIHIENQLRFVKETLLAPTTMFTEIRQDPEQLVFTLKGSTTWELSPLDLQIHCHNCLIDVHLPIHPDIPRYIGGEFWHRNSENLSEINLEDFIDPQKTHRDKKPFETLEHADWWNHIVPEEIPRLLRNNETRNLHKHPGCELYKHLVDIRVVTWDMIENLELPDSQIRTYFKEINPFTHGEPVLYHSGEHTYLERIILTARGFENLLLQECLGHKYGKTAEEQEDACFEAPFKFRDKTFCTLIEMLMDDPNRIKREDEELILETLHKNISLDYLDQYEEVLPPSWYLYKQVELKTIPGKWRLTETLKTQEGPPTRQLQALRELIRRNIESLEIRSIAKAGWIPPEWFQDTEKTNRVFKGANIALKTKIESSILENPAALAHHLADRNSLLRKQLSKKVAANI